MSPTENHNLNVVVETIAVDLLVYPNETLDSPASLYTVCEVMN